MTVIKNLKPVYKPVSDRHQMVMVAVGMSGIGKTTQTRKMLKAYVKDNPSTGKKGRKALAFDINDDDFTEFPSIDPDHLKAFKQVRIRRIRPYTKEGLMMTLEQKREVVDKMVSQFKNGIIVLEDIDKFMTGAKGQTMIGMLCANRHSDLDLLLAHQSIAKISTSVWQNITWLRLHHQVDDIYRYRNRIPNYPIVRIASFIVKEQYHRAAIALEKGLVTPHEAMIHQSYFVYVNMRNLKIRGCSQAAFIRAAKKYIDHEMEGTINMMLQETDFKGNAIYSNKTQVKYQLIKSFGRYHDTTNVNPVHEKHEEGKDYGNEKLAA